MWGRGVLGFQELDPAISGAGLPPDPCTQSWLWEGEEENTQARHSHLFQRQDLLVIVVLALTLVATPTTPPSAPLAIPTAPPTPSTTAACGRVRLEGIAELKLAVQGPGPGGLAREGVGQAGLRAAQIMPAAVVAAAAADLASHRQACGTVLKDAGV